ncbi:MAG TPA: NfeD family protein [Candidatus Limnocylindrales bacterium]|nr:NfeD family protein [Candidatus Limnocylindrales bacterium]
MIDIPVEDFIFVVCALVGGGLLLVTVLVDDILGAIFDFDVGGVSLMPLLLSFVSMFGVGGLFATQVLDVHGGMAAIWGAGFGVVGLALAYGIFSTLRRAEAPEPFSTRDLIGHEAYVQVGIPAGHYGSVLVKAEGQTHEFSATSTVEIAAGSVARVSGVAGSGLIVEPITSAGATSAHAGGSGVG